MKQLWCTIREPLCINIHRLFPWLLYCHKDAGKVNPYLNSTQEEVVNSCFCFILAENSFVMVAHLLNSTVSPSYEWEFCVGSAEDNSLMSDILGRVHALNTTLVLCHIPFSCCNPQDVECGYRFLQRTWEAVKGKYSWGSLVKYSKKDLWLFFRWHCVIAIPSVKGGQIYLCAIALSWWKDFDTPFPWIQHPVTDYWFCIVPQQITASLGIC